MKVMLFYEGDLLSDDLNICKMLDFWGIDYESLEVEEIRTKWTDLHESIEDNYSVLGSSSSLAKVIQFSEDRVHPIIEAARYVYVYKSEVQSCKQLLRYITNDSTVDITYLDANKPSVVITDDSPEICGPMSGLSVPVFPANGILAFRISHHVKTVKSLMSVEKKDVFVTIEKNDTCFVLNACENVVDIDTYVDNKIFDIKDYFFESVPHVMFFQWVFRDTCWRSREIGACLIVDDPMLRPKYGFFDFRKVLELMSIHSFATTIAFIPLSWKKSKSEVAALIKKYPEKYSLIVHGCDHTKFEFGTGVIDILNKKIKLALKRMQLHWKRTGCQFDPIMVFPHDFFSSQSAHVLKHNNFIAAVCNEISPRGTYSTKIRDAWDLAIMRYGDFPIFTRRYVRHGIENYAFDMLLGKPCIIAAHHNDFKNNAHELMIFIKKINLLKCKLHWRGLGEVIINSRKEKADIHGDIYIQMFSNTLNIKNTSDEIKSYVIIKQEKDIDNIENIMVDDKVVDWSSDDSHVEIRRLIPSGNKETIKIIYKDVYGNSSYRFSLQYILKTHLRRYLTEIRDVYLYEYDFFDSCFRKIKAISHQKINK